MSKKKSRCVLVLSLLKLLCWFSHASRVMPIQRTSANNHQRQHHHQTLQDMFFHVIINSDKQVKRKNNNKPHKLKVVGGVERPMSVRMECIDQFEHVVELVYICVVVRSDMAQSITCLDSFEMQLWLSRACQHNICFLTQLVFFTTASIGFYLCACGYTHLHVQHNI
jgi:hypothetical protein